jgi:hypothetical protein
LSFLLESPKVLHQEAAWVPVVVLESAVVVLEE